MTLKNGGNFSVVTPNFNMGEFLTETIESVLANLRPGDNYFIVDGGSTDESVEIIRRYERRLSGWVSERDRGYADALAKGFSRSTSDYQCWINSGDLLLTGALDEARKRLDESSADMIFGDDLYIDEDDLVLQVSNGHAHHLASMMLYGGWTPLQDACYWRRSLYEKVGGIDPSVKYAADYDLFLRMSLSGNCEYVPSIFSAFRKHEGQTSHAHANGYKQERMTCRLREQRKLSDGRELETLLRNFYYWWKVRWRVRLQGENTVKTSLAGRKVSDVRCQSSVAEMA